MVGCTIARLIILTGKYGNPITNLPQIRADFSRGLITYPFYLSFIPMLFGYILALNLGVLAVLERGIRAKLFVLVLLFAMSLMDLSIGTRIWSFNLFLFLISAVLVTYNVVLGRRIALKQLVIVLGCIVLFAVFITIPLYLRSDGKYSFNKCLILLASGYVVGDISSTGYFVEHPMPKDLPGYYTFGGLLKLVDDVLKPLGAGFLSPKDPMNYVADVGPMWGWNTSTDLAYYYSDFGAIGAIIPPYLLGFLSSYFFLKAITYKRILDIQLLAVTFSMILLSPRGIHSEGRFFWILLVVLFVQQRVLNRVSGRSGALQPTIAPS
jgi:oligosaccharide repeat unit polymerase